MEGIPSEDESSGGGSVTSLLPLRLVVLGCLPFELLSEVCGTVLVVATVPSGSLELEGVCIPAGLSFATLCGTNKGGFAAFLVRECPTKLLTASGSSVPAFLDVLDSLGLF